MAESTLVIWLLVAIAVTAATFTCVGVALARRTRRRPSGIFVVGVLFGMVAGPVLQRRSRRLRRLRSVVRVLTPTGGRRQTSRR